MLFMRKKSEGLMKTIDTVSVVGVLAGGVSHLPVAFGGEQVVEMIFGGAPVIGRIVYGVAGVSALWIGGMLLAGKAKK